MNIPMFKFKNIAFRLALLTLLTISIGTIQSINAEDLESGNFKIQDATINNGGILLNSTSYSLIGSLGDIGNDTRLTNGTYAIKSGLEQEIISVPKVQCFETNSNTDNTECLSLPNQKGMIGECGGFGCYSKAKIEIDSQGNPYDTLYTVMIINTTDNIIYYLKSDHTLSLTQSISNYLSKCAIEGKDENNPDCDQIGDSGWSANLQSTNVFYLEPNKTYETRIKALNGDYTETPYSQSKTTTTTSQTISLDIDIGSNNESTVENSSPYTVNILSGIGYQTVQTATNLIWFDFNSNNPNGFNFYINSNNHGLFSSTTSGIIPSEDEDISTDLNNNGGYGIKIYNGNTTQQSLGPLIKSSIYNTAGENIVGAVMGLNKLLFSTSNLNSNNGEILNGRGAIILKARTYITLPIAGDYTDELFFTIIGDF